MRTKALSLLGYFLQITAISLATAPAKESPTLPALQRIEEPTPAYARAAEIRKEAKRLAEARDKDGLEALAAQLRKSKEALEDGTWLLSIFYNWAFDLPDEEPAAAQKLEFYREWARERPQSITAQVGLASVLVDYAWQARGDDWSDAVTAKGWRLFNERLNEASRVLDLADKLPDPCPALAEVRQHVALGLGEDRADYLARLKSALQAEPSYGAYSTSAVYYLLPDWYGEPGDFEKWIAAQAEDRPAGQRDREYARQVWLADQNDLPEEMIFAEGRLDWDRTRRGFTEWLADEPNNLAIRSEFARLAVMADDRETARAQFEITGGQYVPRIWCGKKIFNDARKFAYANGANPFREEIEDEAEAVGHSAPKLSEKAKKWIQLGAKWISGFSSGLLAGLFLFLLARQRGRSRAGVIAWLLCLPLATFLGSPITLVIGAGLWFYLRRQSLQYPPLLHPLSAWRTVVGIALIILTFVGTQLIVGIPILVGTIASQGVVHFRELIPELSRTGALFEIGLSTTWVCFLCLLLVCRPMDLAGWQHRLGLLRTSLGPAIGWVALALLINLGVGFLLEPYEDDRTRKAMEFFALEMQNPFLLFISAVLLAPLIEELVFRGYAYSGWIYKIGFWGTTLLSSLIFMAGHIQYGWVGLLQIFLTGFLLGVLRWKTGSIYPCIVLHALNNFVCWVLLLPGIADKAS